MTLSDLQGHSALFKCDFVQLCRSWQDFNWHGASRGPSATESGAARTYRAEWLCTCT